MKRNNSKSTRKSNRKKSPNQISYFKIKVILVLFLAGVFGIIFSKYNFHQIKSITETPKSEIGKLPPDVKRELAATSSATMRIPILLYHYVEYVQDKKDTIRQSLNINPYTFEQQVITLKDAGFTFMTAKELGNVINGKTKLPNKPILLTFDDGHWDLDTAVLPILKKYNVKATAYIITGFIGWSDFMDKKQLQEVIDSGLVDVGAHTVHHVALKGEPFSLVKNEVDQSKQMLEDIYHISVVSFAYPGGSLDKQAISLVKEAGFTTAVSTIPGVEQNQQNELFLYRIRPGYRTGEALLTYLQQTKFKPY